MAAQPRLTLKDRIVRRLFSEWQPYPWPEHPSIHGVSTKTVAVFDWKDRLRILFGGVCTVKVVSETEHDPGIVSSHSAIYVQRPAVKKKLVSVALALTLTLSLIGCNKAKVATDPTQPPGLSLSQIMEREAARAERIKGYAQKILDKGLPALAEAAKFSEERFNRDRAFLVGLRDKATALAPILRGIGNASIADGRDRAKVIVDEMLALVQGLEESGLHLFPDSPEGQRLESAVRVALALLPEAVRMIKGALSR